jgi:hypothetical protein
MKIPRPWPDTPSIVAAILFYRALLVVIWGELSPKPERALAGANDKALHFIAYFGLVALAATAIRVRRPVFFGPDWA